MARFELNSLLNYDDASLIAEMQRVSQLVEAPFLTRDAFNKLSKCSSSTIHHRFGSWERALEIAGLKHRYAGSKAAQILRAAPRRISDEEMLDELRAVAMKIGQQTVTVEAFNKHGKMSPETIRRRFGSWEKALENAGMTICNLGRRYTDDDYFENLLSAWTHYGRQPTYSEMSDLPSRIRAKAYEAKWGTWRKALLAFIEIAERDDPAELVEEIEESPAESEVPAPVRGEGKRNQRKAKTRRDPSESRHIPLSLRYQILKRDSFRCVNCGKSPSTTLGCELQVDHILAYSRDGKTVLDNLQTLCKVCNSGKGAT